MNERKSRRLEILFFSSTYLVIGFSSFFSMAPIGTKRGKIHFQHDDVVDVAGGLHDGNIERCIMSAGYRGW